MKNTHFEHEHLSKHLDESFGFVGHVGGGFGGGARMGGGSFRTAAPVGGREMSRAALTPTESHLRMVKDFYRHGGDGFNRWGLSPFGRRWFLGGGGFLFGYSWDYLYPIFYDLSLGVYDEDYFLSKYNMSGEQWRNLMQRLIAGGYIYGY